MLCQARALLKTILVSNIQLYFNYTMQESDVHDSIFFSETVAILSIDLIFRDIK